MNVNSKFIIYLNRNRQSMQSSAIGDSPHASNGFNSNTKTAIANQDEKSLQG